MNSRLRQTLFDKLWALHHVATEAGGVDLLLVDRLLIHERTGAVALKALGGRGCQVKAPDRVFAVMDHVVSFRPGRARDEARSPGGEHFITETRRLAETFGVQLIDTDNPRQGIVHVISPELGIALPGVSLLCPDSHTCSVGAMGALGWGIGSSEAEHVMATGVIQAHKPQQMRVTIEGDLAPGVTAKDLALYLIARHGARGGRGCAIEYSGSTIDALGIEARLTLCNLAVEFAAFTAVIAPDEKVYDYVRGRRFAPGEAHWDSARSQWADLRTDAGAIFDYELSIDAKAVRPQISWGTSPEHTIALGATVPENADARALDYMGVRAGQSLDALPIGGVFIGSCTNGRLSDLAAAAEVLQGRKVAPSVRAVCVPGSKSVKRQAEQAGLDVIFKAAGFEWGEPGCAMCFYAGGETFPAGTRVVSSTNRNFEGRQGPGVRTHLASPQTAAASAVAGRIASVSDLPGALGQKTS